MKVCKVNSLPLKEVIESLADCFNTTAKEKCGEYILEIPLEFGKGQIRGLNFDNGLGVIIYTCQFLEDIRIDFTVDDVHPVKYLYSVEGSIEHSFADESEKHIIKKNECAIVASKSKNGHILFFENSNNFEMISLEINRQKFLINTTCEIEDLASELQELFKDTTAKKKFYHDGFFSLEFKRLFADISNYSDKMLIRKFYLESLSLQIFVNQLIQFEDDLLNNSERTILRTNELNAIDEISNYIKDNLNEDLSISFISRKTGLNPNKLQMGFKYLYNTTVNSYINDKKLERACELLAFNNYNISEIVLKVGFESKSYFSKIFKNKFNMTPTDYRNQCNIKIN